MSRKLRLTVIVLILLATALGAVAGRLSERLRAPGPLAEDTIVVLPQGLSLRQVAGLLDDAGAIDEPGLFVAWVRLSGDARRLKAGEYLIPRAASPRRIRNLLRRGDTVVHRFTVAEGLTAKQVVALLRAEPALSGDIAAVPPEGTLLPETYHFSRRDSRSALLERMQAAMERTLLELWAGRAGGLSLATPADALTLASMVEKETAIAEERPRIAAVFVNRLRRGMKLQSDPTVAYGLHGGEAPERPLTLADLARATPFNTYVINGLPPGPIANPGRQSLAAVLNPANTAELYFVADGSGGHAFAATLAEHQRNVREWRRLQARERDRQ